MLLFVHAAIGWRMRWFTATALRVFRACDVLGVFALNVHKLISFKKAKWFFQHTSLDCSSFFWLIPLKSLSELSVFWATCWAWDDGAFSQLEQKGSLQEVLLGRRQPWNSAGAPTRNLYFAWSGINGFAPETQQENLY